MMFENEQIEELKLFPYFLQHILHIRKLKQQFVERMDGNDILLYNIINNDYFIKNENKIISVISLLFETDVFSHGIDVLGDKTLMTIMDAEEILYKTKLITHDELYDIDMNKQLTDIGKDMVFKFNNTIINISLNKKTLTPQSIYIMFDVLQILYACMINETTVDSVMKDLGIDSNFKKNK